MNRTSVLHSQSERRSLLCDNCDESFEADIWVLVDLDSHELLQCIRRGRLHEIKCPHCGFARVWDISFLVFEPAERDFMFVAAQSADDDQRPKDFDHLAPYAQNLLTAIGEEGQATVYITTPAQLQAFIETSLDVRDAYTAGTQDAMDTAKIIMDGDPDSHLARHPELVEQAESVLEEMVSEAKAEGDDPSTIKVLELTLDMVRNFRRK